MTASSFVLDKILSNLNREDVVDAIHSFLRQVGDDVRNGSIPLEKYIITKSLTRNPEEYADTKNQPHVHIALRMKGRGLSFRNGDTVPYVICVVEGANVLSDRAFHFDEAKRKEFPHKIGTFQGLAC